jgi:hypothetical protein
MNVFFVTSQSVDPCRAILKCILEVRVFGPTLRNYQDVFFVGTEVSEPAYCGILYQKMWSPGLQSKDGQNMCLVNQSPG